jgi:transcriptional regulator GlxA family with amidase domain
MPLLEIGLLHYPGAQVAALYGLTDLFTLANRRADAQAEHEGPRLRVCHWQPEASGIACVFDTHPSPAHKPAFLLLPPALGDPITPEVAAPLVPWLRAHHSEGTVLASVCAGAFVLAETGLLAGRRATTHWVYAAAFTARFPDVRVEIDKLVLDDGDLLTAGGLMAWTDLGLTLVGRILGADLMLEVARYLLVDPPGRDQRAYAAFSPRLDHGDGAIVKAQQALHRSGGRGGTTQSLAAEAGLEERTFLRRFQKATGLTPTEYRQHIRIARARAQLERSALTIDQIAWEVGYEDPGAFRKIFHKILGLTPGEYRQRFKVGAA